MQTARKIVAVDDRVLWFLDTLVHIRQSSGDGADGISVIESHAPFGHSPPLHIHHDEDEVFYVLEGTLHFNVGGRDLYASAGDMAFGPRGVPHTFRVESENGGRLLTITRNGSFEAFVRAMSQPAERDGLPPRKTPDSEAQAALVETALRYRIEVIGPPLA